MSMADSRAECREHGGVRPLGCGTHPRELCCRVAARLLGRAGLPGDELVGHPSRRARRVARWQTQDEWRNPALVACSIASRVQKPLEPPSRVGDTARSRRSLLRNASAVSRVRRRSFDHCPGDRGRLAAGKQPSSCGGGQWYADDCECEVEDRHVAEVAEIVVVDRPDDDVGAGDAEQRGEQRKCAGGGRSQRAAESGSWPRSRSGCGGRRRSRCGSVRPSARGCRAPGGRPRQSQAPSRRRESSV